VGNDDGNGNVETLSGEHDGLAVVAPCGGDKTFNVGIAFEKFGDVNDGGEGFEGADGSVVFMLDPDGGFEALVEQGPGDLGRRGNYRIDEVLGGVDFVQGRKENERGGHENFFKGSTVDKGRQHGRE